MVALLFGLATPGLLLSIPIILAWRIVERRKRARGVVDNMDEVAMVKMILVSLPGPLLATFYSILATWFYGFKYGVVSAIGLPPLIWSTVRWFEDGVSSLRSLLTLTRLFAAPPVTLHRLTQARHTLESQVAAYAAQHHIVCRAAPTAVLGRFLNPWKRRMKDWNETMRLYDVPIGDVEEPTDPPS
mmetsp:Transcript_63121/g.137244  ORF Transcript_63121/g.137244 Transcript_63121/m.137244 type:complete len:186 (-) Transcript_63121:65-622(-)